MKNLKSALLSISAMVFILAISLASGSIFKDKINTLQKEPVATHNMLVVGEKAIFFSHLPMFQEKDGPLMPHRFQAILQVGFKKQGSSTDAVYMKDRQSHPGTKIYTVNPEPFVLTKLISPGSQGAMRQFKGNIFRGHFEKENVEILSNVDIHVNRVIYFQEFDRTAKRSTQLQYLLFGKGKELFLAHLITAPPDFDQVVSVTVAGHSFSDEELVKGIKLTIPGTINSPATRLKEKQKVAEARNADTTSMLKKLEFVVNREFYFEEGELKVPAKFGATPEEKKSGFQ